MAFLPQAQPLALSAGSPSSVQQTPAAGRWYKGNTHTHTLNSDGDSTPDEVVRWYREHGYQFLVLTDHNFLTSVDGLNALHGADEQVPRRPGEEVTDTFNGRRCTSTGSTCRRWWSRRGGTSVVDVLQRERQLHPAERTAFRTSIIRTSAGRSRATNCSGSNNKLFEIFNGHPEVNNEGGGGVPGLEEVWDAILSSGRFMYGIAVDDAHLQAAGESPRQDPAVDGSPPCATARTAGPRRSHGARQLLRVHGGRRRRL